MLTVWWIAALILGGIHVILSRWRDFGSPVILGFCVAIVLQNRSPLVDEWLYIVAGVLLLLFGWWRANRREVYRPVLTGLSLTIAVVAIGMPTFCSWVSPDIPQRTVTELTAIICGLTCVLFAVLSLERPRPKMAQNPTLRRTVPINER